MAMRRLTPDPVQLQVIVGSLLGDGRFTGPSGARQLSFAHRRDEYARWKHDRLGAFAAAGPIRADGLTSFATIAHPLFDDLAPLDRAALLRLAGPLGVAVWLTDLGRIELRLDSFLPEQRAALGVGLRATRLLRPPAAEPAPAPVAAQRSPWCAAGSRAIR